MRSRFKTKREIMAVVAAVVSTALLVMAVMWRLDSGKRMEMERMRLNTIELEVPGYEMKVKMVVSKKHYEIKVDRDERPRFPELKIVGRRNGVAMEVRAVKTVTLKEEGDKKAAEVANKLAEFNGDEKKGLLPGYAVMGERGVETWIEVERRGEELYQLKMTVRNAKDVTKSAETFRSKEVQEMLKSVRRLKFEGVKEEVISDDRGMIKLKRLPERVGKFKLEQKSADTNKVVVTGEEGVARMRMEFYVAGWEKRAAEVAKEDYFAKNGKHQYTEGLERLGLTGVATAERVNDGQGERFYYIEKEGVVLRLAGTYSEGQKADFEEVLVKVLRNMDFDKGRVTRFFK